MLKIGVYLCGGLEEVFLKLFGGNTLVTTIGNANQQLSFDILLVNAPRDLRSGLNASALVMNSDFVRAADYLDVTSARLVLTYGFNSKACVTASSISDDVCAICVQRAFTALDGKLVERQEFTVTAPAVRAPVVLAAATAALAAGADVERIKAFL